ncbi:calcium-binding protein, partial [Qipengyuania sphaerica]|uniref:calcium-binding protein n=1 Tax=Qipengyuania sphaerica TaxID=2867243 RepID=UPI002493E1D3
MPTPTEWLAEFQVNTGDAAIGGQIQPKIIGLANGNILVAWVENASGVIGDSAGFDIVGKIYDIQGNVVVDSFQLNQSALVDNEYEFDIAATNDGGFAMTYIDDSLSDPDLVTVRWSRFDETGDEIDTAVIANTNNSAVDFTNPQITVSQETNNSVVTFTRDISGDLDVRGMLIDANGNTYDAFDAGTNGADANSNSDLAILTDGYLVSVYEADIGGTPTIEFQIVNAAGNVRTTVTLDPGTDPKVATLANGNFVIVNEEANNIRYWVYDADGNYVSTSYATALVADENEPDVVALPDGGFVIMWDNDTDDSLQARKFTAAGSADGGAFTITEMNGTDPDVSVTSDGRLLFTWVEAPSGEIHASIWDPRDGTLFTGDYEQGLKNFVDTDYVTTSVDGSSIFADSDPGADLVYGQGGVDIIFLGEFDSAYGGGGNDLIYSGGQGSSVDAGEGDDLVIGAVGGNQWLHGGDGIDKLDLSSIDVDYAFDLNTGQTNFETQSFTAFENASTGDGDDFLSGTSGANILSAGLGADTIYGRGGDDVLNGSSGDDLLEGGSGNDEINGGADTDTASYTQASSGVFVRLQQQGSYQYTEGAGNDRLTGIENLTGSQFRDRLEGDDGSNRIEGLGGDDRVYGHGGNDVIVLDMGNDRAWGGGQD